MLQVFSYYLGTSFGKRYVSTVIKNKRSKTKGKIRGPFVKEGDLIYKEETLTNQQHLLFHPGLNVKIVDKSLKAMCKGRVVISAEKIDPDFNNPRVQDEYKDWKGQPSRKKFFNIIPSAPSITFVLKDLV